VLGGDGGSARAFVITADAQGDVLLNGIPAQPGNAAAITALCPSL